MRFRVGDNKPDVVIEVDTDLTGAIVTSTYRAPDGSVNEQGCGVQVLDVTRNGYTVRVSRVTHTWIEPLSVLGVGSLQFRWESGSEEGTIHPARGWQIEVLP